MQENKNGSGSWLEFLNSAKEAYTVQLDFGLYTSMLILRKVNF